MANENMQEWGHSIIVTDETVKVTKKFLENEEAFLPTKKASKWKNTKAENGQASGEDIEDGTMIQFMANENMQEWGHSIIVIDETVKVAKKFLKNNVAFVAGKKATRHKNTKAERGDVSGEDIANFLGWGSAKIFDSLKRINGIEKGDVDKSKSKQYARAHEDKCKTFQNLLLNLNIEHIQKTKKRCSF